MLRRQKHALSQSTTPFACTLTEYDRVKVPPYNGKDLRPPLVV